MSDGEALYDDLAGVVDLFGALSREELGRALDELAFKQGRDADADALSAAVEGAVREYYLVAYDRDGVEFVVPGPAAFPTLPENAEDLPHILDVDDRAVDGAAATDAAVSRLRADAEEALEADDEDRMERLLDVTYDVELWASGDADVSEVRARLEAAVDG